jgi:exo-1,4-beta-D-glucosaminidase
MGAGVGTPEIGSLKRVMSDDDLKRNWTEPGTGLYHMSHNDSHIYDRPIINQALISSYGKPSNLEEYAVKCQMFDYEATRSQIEAYSTQQNATRPATGLLYWMLKSAWTKWYWQFLTII